MEEAEEEVRANGCKERGRDMKRDKCGESSSRCAFIVAACKDKVVS